MRGVSGIIVVIMLLMISVAMAGLAYTFLSATMASTTSSASSAVSSTVSGMLTSFVIESVDVAKLYIRNTGQSDLSNLSVYVNDALAHFNITPSIIKAGQIGTVTIYDFIQANDNIKITTASGFSVAQKAPDPCAKAVGCWKFDEGSGTTAYDSSPSGNTGTLINGPLWTAGKFGNGLLFDGVNDYVSIPDTSSLNFGTGDFSFSLWLKMNAIGKYYQILSKRINAGTGWELELYPSNILSFIIEKGDGYTIGADSGSVQSNTWYHVVGVFKNNNYVKLYLNAVEYSSTFSGTFNTNANRPLRMGYYEWTNYFNGTIDEVRIYNRAIY